MSASAPKKGFEVAIVTALARNGWLAREAIKDDRAVIDIVVPIHNAASDVARCLQGIATHTTTWFRLVLINDGSDEGATDDLLAALRNSDSGVVLIEHKHALGFVRSANVGLRQSTLRDVVLVNSDVIVTTGWLHKLRHVASQVQNVATVTPLTNHGTICAVPSPNIDNDIPDGYDIDTFATLIERTSFHIRPEAPTGVGFCMLVTRQALDAVGAFDEVTFGDGYGEENDFCQRAQQAGFVNVIADHVFVYHRGGASFQDRREAMIRKNLEALALRYPRYEDDVARFCADHPLAPFHEYLKRTTRVRLEAARPLEQRILHILHKGGGTERHARDLAASGDPARISFVLCSLGHGFNVDEYFGGEICRSMYFPIAEPVARLGADACPAYRDALLAVCQSLSVSLIHVHHLIHNTVDIAAVATALGISYVVTFHDYYFICPSYTLLTVEGAPCGACLDPSNDAPVAACVADKQLSGEAIANYRGRMERFLRSATRRFVPNTRTREIIAQRYPDLPVEVIEHGMPSAAPERPTASPYVEPPTGRSLNVALLGGIERHKGLAVFQDLLRLNKRQDVVFHLYGWSSDPSLLTPLDQTVRLHESSFVYHGPYRFQDIADRLQADSIDLGLHLSIWPETFSYTLGEFSQAGIPVIGSALGAQGERIARCRLGWTVSDIRKASDILGIIERIRENPSILVEVRSGISRDLALPSMDTMWHAYSEAYQMAHNDAAAHQLTRNGDPEKTTYPAFLAMRLRELNDRNDETRRVLDERERELAHLQQLLRSPRHRVATAAAEFVQRIPIVWPVLSFLTDAMLNPRRRSKQS